jgi:hypothetical protein
MKPSLLKTSLLVFALASLPAAAGGPGFGPPAGAPRLLLNQAATVVAPLEADEAAVLLWMREEEKLARDVYQTLYGRWQSPVFRQIAASEQRHFDAIGAKLALFGLTDPALAAVGQFANAELQVLFDQLTATGLQTYGQALAAGALIEETDIRDLQAALDDTDNTVLRLTYGHLLDASKNHLRAFVARLQDIGIDYLPQVLDPLVFDAIVDF